MHSRRPSGWKCRVQSGNTESSVSRFVQDGRKVSEWSFQVHSSWSRDTGPKILPQYQGVFTGYATKFKWEKENFTGRSISARVITQSTRLKEHFLSLFILSLLWVCHGRVVSALSRSQVVFGIRVFISNFMYVVLGGLECYFVFVV